MNILAGYPPGSVLGPLLFLIYINDPQQISSELLLFTDDVKFVTRMISWHFGRILFNLIVGQITVDLCSTLLSVK